MTRWKSKKQHFSSREKIHFERTCRIAKNIKWIQFIAVDEKCPHIYHCKFYLYNFSMGPSSTMHSWMHNTESSTLTLVTVHLRIVNKLHNIYSSIVRLKMEQIGPSKIFIIFFIYLRSRPPSSSHHLYFEMCIFVYCSMCSPLSIPHRVPCGFKFHFTHTRSAKRERLKKLKFMSLIRK